jgi:hypothetical protein
VTTYAIYEPAEAAPDIADRAEQIAFVKEGFSWPALFFPAFWLIYQRMWIELGLLVLLFLLIASLLGTADLGSTLVNFTSFGVVVLFAFEANDLLGAALERRGYRYVGTVIGPDREAAELSFFKAWLPERRREERPPERGLAPQGMVPSRRTGEGDEVIGVFPKP